MSDPFIPGNPHNWWIRILDDSVWIYEYPCFFCGRVLRGINNVRNPRNIWCLNCHRFNCDIKW